MRRPPAHDSTFPAHLAQDVPDRLGPPRDVRDGTDATATRIRLCESINAVLEWSLSSGNRRPQHGRKIGVKGSQVADNTAVHQPFQVRHLPGIHERIDHLPVRSVPADQKNLALTFRSNHPAYAPKHQILPLAEDPRGAIPAEDTQETIVEFAAPPVENSRGEYRGQVSSRQRPTFPMAPVQPFPSC